MKIFHLLIPLRVLGNLCETSDTTDLQCVNGFFTLFEQWYTATGGSSNLAQYLRMCYH